MRDLQAMLLEHHQYVPVYWHAYEVPQHYDSGNNAQVQVQLSPGLNQQWYNLPTADEVAVILLGNPTTEPCTIVLYLQSGPLHCVIDLHSAYTPPQYPLLFPQGENGWYPEMRLHETEDQQNHCLQQCAQRQDQHCDLGMDVGNDWPADSRRLILS